MGTCSTKEKLNSGYEYAVPANHPPTHGKSAGACPVSSNATGIVAGTGSAQGNGAFVSTFDVNVKVSLQTIFEHYQPYEFPIVPIINSHTQTLVRASFKKILDSEFDSEDTVSGKMSGATYFYNQFFKQLFLRLKDFERIFPDIKSRAEIISKVMAMVLSIRVEELELAKHKLRSLGAKHIHIVQDPWLFGVYTTTIHSTIRLCLGDDANEDTMSAWLHLLAWVLRNMLPEYFERMQFTRYYDGATNAASAVTDKHREEIKTSNDVKQLRSAMRTANRSGVHSGRSTHGNQSEAHSRRVSPPPERELATSSPDRNETGPESPLPDASPMLRSEFSPPASLPPLHVRRGSGSVSYVEPKPVNLAPYPVAAVRRPDSSDDQSPRGKSTTSKRIHVTHERSVSHNN